MSFDRSPLLLVAQQELTLAVRSRWTQIFAVVFAGLALAVAASGYILSGGYGVQDFARTSASLIQLVVILVPLASLVIGILSIAPERGAAELLFSQPVSRGEILFGQMLGLFVVLAVAEAVGFGAAGMVIFARAGGEDIVDYLILFASALALTAVFVSIAAWIGSTAVGRKKTRALAVALVVWFVAVILFDVAVLGVASLLRSGHASRLLIVASIVNPVDAVRVGSLLAIEGTTAFGAASLALLRFAHGAPRVGLMLGLSVLIWIVIPAGVAIRRLRRIDL